MASVDPNYAQSNANWIYDPNQVVRTVSATGGQWAINSNGVPTPTQHAIPSYDDLAVLRNELESQKSHYLTIVTDQEERICQLEEVVGELRAFINDLKQEREELKKKKKNKLSDDLLEFEKNVKKESVTAIDPVMMMKYMQQMELESKKEAIRKYEQHVEWVGPKKGISYVGPNNSFQY